MKISLSTDKGKSQSFTGFKITKDESGFKSAEFSYPYDSNKQEVSLEFYKLGKDEYNNYFTTEVLSDYEGRTRFNVSKGINRFDMAETFGIADDEPFGYNYHIKNKGGQERIYLDAGDNIPISGQSGRVNIVLPNGSVMSKGGSMKLVIPDSQNVGVVYNKDGSYRMDDELRLRAENDIKTLWNKMGGTLAGIEKDIDDGKYDSYSRIIGLPIFARDRLSAHQYWLEEMFQISPTLGNINNYASLQRKLFAHGINWVSDGAFVNEGLQGTHFSHMLKWGMNSPFYRWFRANSRQNALWSLGIFPNDTKNVSFKLINHPKKYKQVSTGKVDKSENLAYNPKKPTYIQYLDKRYVQPNELENESIIKSYTVSSKDNVYDLHTHDDSTFPVLVEIDPNVFDRNIDDLNAYNKTLSKDKKIKLKDFEGTRFVSKFENWYASGKHESGFETWDANPDIAKLNFVQSNTETMALKNLRPYERERERKRLSVANAQVQDYAVEVGRYWTRTTDDILRLYIAQNLKNIDTQNPKKVYNDITDKANGKIFPNSIDKVHKQLTENEVRNVLAGEYENKRKLSYEDKNSQILEGLMNYPLEAVEFENNLVSIFASPLIAKRASNFDEIEMSRYDIYKLGNPNLPKEYKETYTQMEEIYKNQMSKYAIKVLDEVNKKLPNGNKLFEGDNVTEYGRYTLPILLTQIAKYSIIKSLAPNIEAIANPQNGEIIYDYDELNKVCTQSIGIDIAASPQDEANLLLEKLRNGMDNLRVADIEFMRDSILKTLAGTNADSFKLADLIIDKTQAGLDWRIDATKDIADIEALHAGYMNFEDTWQDITDFWSRFARGIYKENRNAYMVAEVTNEHGLWNEGWGSRSGKYSNASDINQKFIRETGMTSIADYSNYFYNIVKLFSRSPQDGTILETRDDGHPVVDENPNQLAMKLRNILMDNEGKGALKNNSLPSAVYSYTFFSNHDKPRPLHCSALDMEMFYSDFTFDTDTHRIDAYRLLKDDWFSNPEDIAYKASKYNFNSASPMAVAMGLHLHKIFMDVLKNYEQNMGKDKYKRNFIAINKALCDLSNGRYNEKVFEADAFGVKPIDINIEMVLKQARKYHGLDMTADFEKKYSDEVFELAMKPAMNKILAMTKVLAAFPGMPTLFDGDDLGATGYDTETKNMYVACRQKVHNEWADEKNSKYKKFIKDYKKMFDDVMAIRRKPECNALNNGAPFVLPMQEGRATGSGYVGQLPAVLQQSTDGRMTISVINLHKQHNEYRDYNKMYDNEKDYKPLTLELDSIKLNFENAGDVKDGALGIGIPGIENGTKFQNANNPNDWYTVNEVNGKYFLKHDTNNGKIIVDDTTLVLYHVPTFTKPMTFTGRIKPCTDYVTGAYVASLS